LWGKINGWEKEKLVRCTLPLKIQLYELNRQLLAIEVLRLTWIVNNNIIWKLERAELLHQKGKKKQKLRKKINKDACLRL